MQYSIETSLWLSTGDLPHSDTNLEISSKSVFQTVM